MNYIDMHCDTLMNAVQQQKRDFYDLPNSSVTLQRLADSHVGAQFMAMFLPDQDTIAQNPKVYSGDDDKLIAQMRDILQHTIDEHPDLAVLVTDAASLHKANQEHKVGLFLTIEDGRSVRGRLDRLKHYYDMGVRLIGLTWNGENCFGFPNSFEGDVMSRGLKPFGKDAVCAMNDMGMLIDVSHLSDGGFWDVEKLSEKPFVASHSNARALSAHPRNLNDDQIRALAKKGGVMGLNFCPPFLGENIGCTHSQVGDMVRHITHILNVGGEDVLALGTDFDGIGGQLEISQPNQMILLWDALKKAGLSEAQLEKMAYQNVLRVIKDTL